MIGESVYVRAYVRALFGAAAQRGELDGVTQDIRALEAQWQGSPELRIFCTGHLPGAPLNHARLVDNLWGTTFSEPVRYLLRTLAQWDHLRLIPLITEQYRILADKKRGCTNVRACFACEPQPEEIERIRLLVASAYGPLMNLTVEIDSELIAGLRLFINDKRVDASLAGRLARIRYGLSKPMQLDEAAG
jgi:F-type H+-transporting ATPase subunit delta